ncbi:hypothetical protein OC25_10355 [Pedobacter kyungheensis]|uniref:Uncharacterized protein n=1 Tax=Pedobacter kyungheensis TaxID=1069985 RepID=A0A0C1FMV3_9SPHI|nr:hypothetical protein OC25_10355 [Pedobacter kyungheensis]
MVANQPALLISVSVGGPPTNGVANRTFTYWLVTHQPALPIRALLIPVSIGEPPPISPTKKACVKHRPLI